MRKDLQTAVPVEASNNDSAASAKTDTNRRRKAQTQMATTATKASACPPSKLGKVLLQRQFKQLSTDPPDGISVWLEVQILTELKEE